MNGSQVGTYSHEKRKKQTLNKNNTICINSVAVLYMVLNSYFDVKKLNYFVISIKLYSRVNKLLVKLYIYFFTCGLKN